MHLLLGLERDQEKLKIETISEFPTLKEKFNLSFSAEKVNIGRMQENLLKFRAQNIFQKKLVVNLILTSSLWCKR